jgi:hypothetical protein
MRAAGQQLGVDMANNFMLMTLFSLIADMSDDPDGFRTDVCVVINKLCCVSNDAHACPLLRKRT